MWKIYCETKFNKARNYSLRSFFAPGGNGAESEASVYEMARVMYVVLSRAERELYLVTDGREFPNMQGVYEVIEKQAEPRRATQ